MPPAVAQAPIAIRYFDSRRISLISLICAGVEIGEQDVSVGHEASVSRIGEEQLFYLMSRGLSEAEASTMIVNGFIEPIVKELPMEYAVELNRLIELQMEGAVG